MPPTDPLPARLQQRRQVIGENIRRARLRANLTQERLGERCGIDRQAINRIEMGAQSPLLDTLLRIADALDVPLAELVQYG